MYINQIKSNPNQSQHKNQKKPLNKEKLLIINKVEQEVRKWYRTAPGQIDVFNALVFYSNIYELVFTNQENLGKRAGVSREWVNKSTQKLKNKFYIEKRTVHRRSCEYEINPIFLDPLLRWRLRDIIPAFRWLPKVLLTAAVSISQPQVDNNLNLCPSRQFTPIINKQVIYKKQGIGNCKITANRESKLSIVSDKFNKEESLFQIENIHKQQCDNLNKGDPPRDKNELMRLIEDRKRMHTALTQAYALSGHWATRRSIDQVEAEISLYVKELGEC